MNFFKWYGGFLSDVCKGLTQPILEIGYGLIFLIVVSLTLWFIFSPWWLFLTIPLGFTIVVHGYWREERS